MVTSTGPQPRATAEKKCGNEINIDLGIHGKTSCNEIPLLPSCCSPWPPRIPALPFCHVALKARRPLPDSYPKSLKTMGDHIRKRRLDLGLLQSEVARQIGVCTSTVCNWEGNESTPVVRFMPAIQAFLGYDPAPEPNSIADRIRLG
jgi:DNA-binding XRE family transcriptional regulator